MTHSTGKLGKGFTLLEVLMTAIILGVCITALMAGMASNSQVNSAGSEISQAVLFAQDIREWTMSLPFRDPDPAEASNPPGPDGSSPQVFVDDLDDLMNVTFSPPRDSQGKPLSDMSDWSQTITLTWRSLTDPTQTVPAGSTTIVNVNVSISHYGVEVLSSSWLKTEGLGSQ